ncbi:DJ-1/PfpI family protein [Glaciecola petra]|uniref:DJ-1/PfpI family protein n=1 Tax=Glaciecola petra TaxID=3075602 RepID=A0ABU2ZRL1_9ALTE|nr:DJ-1/PfpI family protein [Aestuariibacter sp. P117]MDT0595055.1 DJ-1/PfpI family protein [Aestuariibacter sp. P117]
MNNQSKANQTVKTQKRYTVTILAYPGMTMLDAIGPNDILGNSEFIDLTWASTEKDPISNDMKSLALSDLTYFKDISSTDVLLVPGGAGDHYVMQRTDVLAWIKQMNEQTILTTSVCTGALILAKTGILRDIKSCSHWACLDELKKLGAKPERKRFVHDGKYVSSSGVSAGIDMSLYLLKKLVSKEHARDIRFAIEYFPNQFHLFNSYTLPKFLMAKLAKRFHAIFKHARSKVINEKNT